MRKKISAKTVLCDIDSTITDIKPGLFGGDFREGVFQMLSRHIARRMGIAEPAARETLDTFANNLLIWWDYPDFINHFRLDARAVWNDMRRLHSESLFVHEDAVEMVKWLKSAGKEVHIVSNNPITGCLMKLERAGLAELTGTPYFKRVFGTNVTRGMKSLPSVWRWIIASLDANPEDVLTIGDSVKEDCDAPAKAGISKTIIVDRKLDRDMLVVDGHVKVRSLSMVKEALR